MPDLSGIPAIDVALGLAFLFFLLSIVCSSINEAIASFLRLRSRTLERGIRSLLDDDHAHTAAFYGDRRVIALIEPTPEAAERLTRFIGKKPAGAVVSLLQLVARAARFVYEPSVRAWRWVRGRNLPSYIPSRVFTLAVLDAFVPKEKSDKKKEQRTLSDHAAKSIGDMGSQDQRLADQARQALLSHRLPETVRVVLEDALAEAGGDAAHFRRSVERSFDEVMDRASGWYKRRVQLILFVIAVALACAINADSFAIGQRLWQDDALRATVVAQATQTGQDPCSTKQGGNTPADKAVKCLDTIDQLKLPLGWRAAPKGVDGYLAKLIGVLITAFALTLGAPFWFDLLGKVARLRGSGPTSAAPATGKAPQADTATTARS
jgi:hypothetical protein